MQAATSLDLVNLKDVSTLLFELFDDFRTSFLERLRVQARGDGVPYIGNRPCGSAQVKVTLLFHKQIFQQMGVFLDFVLDVDLLLLVSSAAPHPSTPVWFTWASPQVLKDGRLLCRLWRC